VATLHYGGHIRKNGSLSPMPSKGSSFKKLKRLEYIIRMENAGLPEKVIATMLTISVGRLRYIKKSADYLRTRMRLTTGIILDDDIKIADLKEHRKEILTQMLPPALQVIANILGKDQTRASIAEQKLMASVAQDIMDREGTLAKVSRTEVKPVDAFDFERADATASDILTALRGAASSPNSSRVVSSGALEANTEFSNSNTISAVDQQKALAAMELEEASDEDLDISDVEPASTKIQ
jgi:hypothetical protein